MDLAPKVEAILVLDTDGFRICSLYYTEPYKSSHDTQLAFEKKIHEKTKTTSTARVDAEILLFEQHVVLYKFISDVVFFVVAGISANELIMAEVLSCLEESMQKLLRNQVEKANLMESLDFLLLVIDEIVDEGIIVEIDSSNVTPRVCMQSSDEEIPLSEQTITQALQTAKTLWFSDSGRSWG